jgi:uncharacterized protein YjcR
MSARNDSSAEVSAKELAERLGTDPKELRKWLRAEGLGAGGHGKRYAFTPQKAGQLAKRWESAQKEEADES